MKINPRLHHCAQNITKDSLEDVIDMFKIFDCTVNYRPDNGHKWAMVSQKELRFSIQIVEVNNDSVSDIEIKKQTHIAFISDNPQKLIDKVGNWAKDKDIKFKQGGWSSKELYFDLPDIFVNFVVEVMHSSIVGE